MISTPIQASMLTSIPWSPGILLIAGSYDKASGFTYTASDGHGRLYLTHNTNDCSILSLVNPSTLMIQSERMTSGLGTSHLSLLNGQILTADYTSGSISVFPIDPSGTPMEPEVLYFTGQGPDHKRQESAHIHFTILSPDGLSLVAVDLGADKLYRFEIKEGKLLQSKDKFHGATVINLPDGCGPRHCAFSPNGNTLYVITELSDEILVIDYRSGRLLQRQSVHAENPKGGSHILLSPDGKKVYTSVRVSSTDGNARCTQRDRIVVFDRDDTSDLLSLSGSFSVGAHPRHFEFAPCSPGESVLKEHNIFGFNSLSSTSPKYWILAVACRDENAIQVFVLDSLTGLPIETAFTISVKSPDSVIFIKN